MDKFLFSATNPHDSKLLHKFLLKPHLPKKCFSQRQGERHLPIFRKIIRVKSHWRRSQNRLLSANGNVFAVFRTVFMNRHLNICWLTALKWQRNCCAPPIYPYWKLPCKRDFMMALILAKCSGRIVGKHRVCIVRNRENNVLFYRS